MAKRARKQEPVYPFADDSEWPPHVAHNPAIERGDGARWHYLAAPDVLEAEGILDANEIPGHPECNRKWHYVGFPSERVAFIATRLGNRIAVTILELGEGKTCIMRCVPLRFTPR
ncbi:MAG TPA: hypothetical protein VFC24_09855 [Casimicrobiaceae bacterium]|nr:hypothetical protein [Casimicrobiaceae bacterium]